MTSVASSWVQRWSHLVPPDATVLDVACGSGRHVRWFAARGARVTGVDRDATAAEPLRDLAEIVVADIEHGAWPFAGRRFDAVVVTHYLWRALLPVLVGSVADGGVLIYETFADGNQTIGKPSNPDFLLRPGELLQAVSGLRVIAYEDGFVDNPERFVQRITAMRLGDGSPLHPRLRLSPGAGAADG
ncbi:class I SAM-dependent methyltransferase [Rhizobacter sp. J219]|uniref:class I SAM-dependent methyltransferase n=1 Tax=Rhizobacter sp. J219 TaxID=2898430 RepID=UPI002150D51F|nr:class I SAM-dependent methyltransferase [Rhizobacter sp. J219]MCR5881521.1 class I SAM-dependent methyltransferase [Rhizobacter sp. J219]